MPRMMKGGEEPEMLIGAILFVASLAIIFGIIFSNFAQFTTELAESQDKIAAINEVHRVAACLSDANGFSAEPSDIKVLQGMLKQCDITYNICVKDIETGRYWDDSLCPISKPEYTIYITIKKVDGTTAMGELNVKA